MNCPRCQHPDSAVLDSRMAKDGNAIRRRRRCKDCDFRFTTYERVELVLPAVIKRDESRENFRRDKLRAGVVHACRKRPGPATRIDELVAAVERHFADRPDREVRSSTIGETVLERLRALDEVAYVRFASVYRDFQDVQQFVDELEKLQAEPG